MMAGVVFGGFLFFIGASHGDLPLDSFVGLEPVMGWIHKIELLLQSITMKTMVGVRVNTLST